MLLKLLVIALLLIILYCLGSGLVFLLRKNSDRKMVKALTWRITLSVILFILLIISFNLGWITPHGI